MTKGFAGVKFSGSPKRFGENRASVVSANSKRMKPKMSFREK